MNRAMTPSIRAVARQRGVTLVELLVGIVIGMLTVLVITQVFLNSEQQRRTPAAGANAQINGILALDAIQRDVRQSGYGLGGGMWLGQCPTAPSSEAATVGLSSLTLAPLLIQPGSGSTPSDSIEVLSSGKIDAAMPLKLAETHDSGSGAFIIRSPMGVETGDWLIVATGNGQDCAAFQAQAVTTSAPWGITPNVSVAGIYDDKSVLSNMGASPIRRRWSVAGSSAGAYALQMTNLATDSASPGADDAYPGVVLLRALYAKDTEGDGSIDTYDTTAPASLADWKQVVGVRLALVVRSPERSKDVVTAKPIQWDLGKTTSDITDSIACELDSTHQCLELKFEHTVPNGSDEWKYYRYRMYESMIPLRNLIWNAAG